MAGEQYLSNFKGKRVLVTGHTGFKGSWLVLWLQELGAEVAGLALEPHTNPSLFVEGNVSRGIEDHRCNIDDFEATHACIEKINPEVVFHLAAQPLVRASYTLPRETYQTNMMGSLHVFEAIRHVKNVSVLVHVGTDKVYENFEWEYGYREVDSLGGHDPYSSSKAAAEIGFLSYCKSFFNPEGQIAAASGRAGNVIGGGDWAEDRIVPDIARALSANEPIGIRNPVSVRPWQHVLEALSGYLTLGGRLLNGDTIAKGSWNFGPPTSNIRTVEALVQAMTTAWGRGDWQNAAEVDAVHEAGLLTLCCDKAHSLLGWHPKWNFEQTMAKTAGWYKAYEEGVPARDLCLRDIQAYMSDQV